MRLSGTVRDRRGVLVPFIVFAPNEKCCYGLSGHAMATLTTMNYTTMFGYYGVSTTNRPYSSPRLLGVFEPGILSYQDAIVSPSRHQRMVDRFRQ